MRKINVLTAVLLLLFSTNAFGFACAGSENFNDEQLTFNEFGSAQEISSFKGMRSGTVFELSGSNLSKYSESVPVALMLETEAKGKIYYTLSTKEDFFSSEDYPKKSVFTWVDGEGASLLDGVKKSVKPENCVSWNKQIDALELDLTSLESNTVLTAFAVPRDSFFVLLCAPSNVTVSVHYLDGSGGSFNAGKGIFNSGTQSMLPIGVYSRQQQDVPLDFIAFAKEKLKEKKACVSDSIVNWNLNDLIEDFPSDLTALTVNQSSAPLEPDSDEDGVPDSTDENPNAPNNFSSGTDYRSLASGAGSLIVFMPVKWGGSASFESKVDEIYSYFMEKSGLGGCKNISKIVLSESDVVDCGLESIRLECVSAGSALGLIENCARQKAGSALNSKEVITVGVTDFLNLSVKENTKSGPACMRAPAFTGPAGGSKSVLTSIEAPHQLAHEIGHIWFNFCDQYSLDAFLYQNSAFKRQGIQGCGNKWPGPYEYGSAIKLEHLYEAVLTYSDIQQSPSFNPSECKDYDTCPDEKGKALTCCPNIYSTPESEANCTGRFMPLSNGKNAVSIMGPVFEVNITRGFDCKEKTTIKAVTGC